MNRPTLAPHRRWDPAGLYATRVRILTVVGNRPQFIKAAAVSGPLRERHEELLVHTGQHYDDSLSRVFFAELGLAAPDRELGIGGGSNTSQTARMLAALEPLLAAERPAAVLVYGDTNSTLAGALAGAQAGAAVIHVEAGMRSFEPAMPEEQNRVLTDHLAALLLCSSDTAAANLARESVAGRVQVVGDVMVDVALRRQPSARADEQTLRAHGVTPGDYLLLTAHRAGNVDDPARLRALAELVAELAGPVILSLHPRTRARLADAGLLSELAQLDGLELSRAARLRAVQRAALPGARGPHRLRWRPKGGVPCGGAVRDAASNHRVGRDGGERLEHARRPRRAGGAGRAGQAAAARATRAVWRRQRRAALRAGDRLARCAGARGAMSDERALRVGVVGLGYWGPNLARNFAAIPGCELRWICDPRREAREAVAPSFPRAIATAEMSDLLEDPELDAVVLATPVPTHARLATSAAHAGKHCFVEKPLATNVADAERAVAAAAHAGTILMVGHLLEYHPAVDRLKALIDDEELGQLYYVYANRLNLGQLRADENALWSLGAHDVAVVLHLVGEEPEECLAHGASYLREGVQDVVFCYLRFPSGIVAHLHLSWLDPHKERRVTVVGARRMATFDDMLLEGKLTVYDKGFDEDARSWGEYIARSGDIFSPRIANAEPLRIECEHFVRCLGSGETPRSDGESGLRVVRVLERLQRSLEAGAG